MEMITIPKHEYDAMKALITALMEQVTTLTAKVTELEAQLNKNSNNSNKPPSSDGPCKKVKNSRIKSDKKSGGQPGHAGCAKLKTPTPDRTIKLVPQTQCNCGGNIIVQDEDFIVRQIRDIQPIRFETVEYRAHDGKCNVCGKVHKASFPQGVAGTVSYGENMQAILTYLNVYQLVPLKRTTELMKDLFGEKISQGTITNSTKAAYAALAPVETQLKEEIIQADVAGFDESGMRVNGRTFWLHTAGTETCTVYGIHRKRGKEAMDAMGILPYFEGTAIHDHWGSYYQYLCAHGECNEHHLRHLKYLHEDLGQAWAGEMACLLLRIKRHVDISRVFDANELPIDAIAEYEGMYRNILSTAGEDKSPHIESRRMIKRMVKFEQETLLFMYDFDVPFTNNLAERDIRMPKAKQKISGGFRSVDGANHFARIRGFVSTAKKRGKNVYEGLVAVFNGAANDYLFS